MQENEPDCLNTQIWVVFLMDLTHWRGVSLYSALNYLRPTFLADAHPFSHHWKEGVSSCYDLSSQMQTVNSGWLNTLTQPGHNF